MAAAAVVESRGLDSPSTFSESQADADDIIFPCKGCGEILEEGKAFELAGNRWHIDCFRCNTCGTLLDSDANLLLLGDGSLICNNCTYSCNACGNKIEDLAILTGDQAFCSACFRCRNCKRKIENLRYARTSQGIFCMSCHESLMARRRKKSSKTPKPAQNGSSGAVKEKALPSLPPGAVPTSAFSPDMETPPSETYSGTPGAKSPPERSYYPPQRPLSSRGAGTKRDVSPMSDDARKDGPTLPASTYGDRRPSNVDDDSDDGEERGFLPMAFDPNPVAPPVARKAVPRPSDSSPPASDGRPPPDYFTRASKGTARDARKEEERARSVSTEREPERSNAPPNKSSPHIFYQEKGRSRKREVSGNNTPSSLSGAASPLLASAQEKTKTQQVEAGPASVSPSEGFRLQEVPKSKKAASRSNSKAESPSLASPASPALEDGSAKNLRSDIAMSNSPVSMTSQNSGVNPFDDPKRREGGGSTPAPPRPVRGDSLAPHAYKAKQTSPTDPPTTSFMKKAHSVHGRQESTNSANFVDAKSIQSRDESGSKTVESPQPTRTSFDMPPPRSSSRPTGPSAQNKQLDNFTAPRAPPPPPPPAAVSGHKQSGSISTLQSNEGKTSDGQLSPGLRSAGLPKHSMDSPFSMDDEMTRIMRGEAKAAKQAAEGGSTSMMRKVSNAVKHGRSFSDRGLHSAGKSSANGGIEIGSPMNISSPLLASPSGKESYDDLVSQLRRARARITELEADYGTLEAKMNSSTEIRNATNELREKRDTITVLDTQREVVVRELEAMTEHLAKAKDNKSPLDIPALKSELLKDFSKSLQQLKEDMSAEIEDLMHKRNELTDEISKLIQMKDKGFQEYEALSNKNSQLQEMNNQILSNIQDTYKANRVPNGGANGLGIYHPGPPKSSESQNSTELRNLNLVSTDSSMPDLLRETEAEPATVLTAPQVVNIRKGQPKKFNWRKGGERMAKNVTKGIKGAFVSERREGESLYGNISVPYNQAQQAGPGSDQGSINGRQGLDGPRTAGPGFGGFFGGQKNAGGGLKPGALGSMKNSSSTNLASTAVEPSVLFGSDLTARCEYEKRLIPAIVGRCIEEVEARGMDMEGVYRKSGGSGQVKQIQLGFEKDAGYDISDPDLDIHAVTSTLKQYFRKLPDPLITYEAYETLLAAGQEKEKGAQVSALRQAIAELPEHHRDTLEFLVQHLARVVELESMNLMTPLNLAVVFAPTIMRPLSIEREMSDMQAQRVALQALLENWRAVFEE